RGYWWPYKGAPLYGSANSPLSKYDRYVQAHTGSNPNSVSWERTNHRYKGVSWEGHCNGWAASAVLRAEPRVSRRDPVSGITFSVGDQKGLLAETDYCAKVAFFGTRYPKGSRQDIFPDRFHKTLGYYISNLGKPVNLDYNSAGPVDNHVITGYSMNIQSTGTNVYTVTAKLTVHKYDSSSSAAPGMAPTYIRNYKYQLHTDSAGNILRGTWLTNNPDFLWVPLSPTECSSNNPRINSQMVLNILNL